jgi:acetyltransferase-like isoleucine patch superfamily enzyme
MISSTDSLSLCFLAKEKLLPVSLAWIPTWIGIGLRRVFYPYIFNQMGRDVLMKTGIEFNHACRTQLGNQVYLDRNIRIRCISGQVVIGNRVHIDQGAEIYCYSRKPFIIGDQTKIGSYCRLSGHGSLSIGRDCLLGPHVGIFTSNHVFSSIDSPINQQGLIGLGVVIEDDCWLGCGVQVMDGIRIGKGSVIGAGAVVTKSLPPYSIAVGAPARIIGKRDQHLK